MKAMRQIVRFLPFSTFLRIFRWTPRVTVNISLAYFPISAIIVRGCRRVYCYRPGRWQISFQDRLLEYLIVSRGNKTEEQKHGK